MSAVRGLRVGAWQLDALVAARVLYVWSPWPACWGMWWMACGASLAGLHPPPPPPLYFAARCWAHLAVLSSSLLFLPVATARAPHCFIMEA